MAGKKIKNKRCPLQAECEKTCDYVGHELDCIYYQTNGRGDSGIPDQEELRETRERNKRRLEEEALMDAISVDDNEDDPSVSHAADTSPYTGEARDVEGVVPYNDGVAVGGLVMISVDKIEPHPDNPRKELGDLEELTASIKAKGILQNLTVVPWFPADTRDVEDAVPYENERNPEGLQGLQELCDGVMDGYYRALIGHRRLAAAKAAGLTEVPCVIADLTHEEQIEVMLLENMQRSDLTAYEQGQAFQMLMDFGNDVFTISEKTGFSESTVRRRLKLAELDGAALRNASEKQVTFEELERLSKIEDVKTRNLVLCEYGTRNYEYKLQQALDAQKKEENIARWRKIFARRGITEIPQKDCFNWELYKHVGYVNYDWEEEQLERLLKEEKTYYFCDYYGSFRLRTDKAVYDRDEEEREPTPEELERERKQAAENARREALKEAGERAYRLRHDFIKNFHVLAADQIRGQITTLLIKSAVMLGELDCETDKLCELMGIPLPEEWSNEMMLPEITAYTERNPGRRCCVSCI